jgi:Winged helix DNA-binding domain
MSAATSSVKRMVASVTRAQVLAFRVRAQQLDRDLGDLAHTSLLDIGAQDSGADGALWALAVRGVDVSALAESELAMAWTIRGAPHVYRRADLPSVAAAVEPFSEADATKRIYDAAKPLKAAGITSLAGLDAVAATMRSVVVGPTGKGEVSARVAAMMDPPYLRFCRACNATHLYEMPFRLAALRAGLELVADTSPPVLARIPLFTRAATASPRHEVIRGYLRLLGPATPKHVASYLDAPVKEVTAGWPGDTVEVSVDGEQRWVLAGDESSLATGAVRTTRLLGPYDLFVQAKDRSLLVDDPARTKALWPVLGRPGAVLLDGEVAGMWRPRTSSKKLTVRVELWTSPSKAIRKAINGQAERLAAHRHVSLSGVAFED